MELAAVVNWRRRGKTAQCDGFFFCFFLALYVSADPRKPPVDRPLNSQHLRSALYRYFTNRYALPTLTLEQDRTLSLSLHSSPENSLGQQFLNIRGEVFVGLCRSGKRGGHGIAWYGRIRSMQAYGIDLQGRIGLTLLCLQGRNMEIRPIYRERSIDIKQRIYKDIG